jgi:pimeloyl-ACP methyl ester carboxylesterase
MPFTTTDDGVKLYYESTGSGQDIIFVHEFGGDYRSWEPQIRHFSRRYRCITFNARGWPPSEVPQEVSSYSQARAVQDILCVLNAVQSERAHVVGLSMGGFAALHLGLTDPGRTLSLCVAGCGYGAEPDKRTQFANECENIAKMLLDQGMDAFVEKYAQGPTRVQFENKDPRGFAEFKAMFKEHSALGSANTQLGVQRARPSLYDLADQLQQLSVPTLIVNGDEDWACLAPGLMMKHNIPSAGLVIFPNVGHTINLEVPHAFNRELDDFFASVEGGRWPMRDHRANAASITGMGK